MATEKGQASLEALLSLGLSVVALSALIWLATLVSTKIYINHCTYEAAVCALGTAADCKQQLRRKLGAVPWIQIQHLEIMGSNPSTWARVRAQVVGLKIRETENAVLP